MHLPRPVSAFVDFIKAIQRDRLESKISRALDAGDITESFHRLNELSHDHGGDPQIPAFVFNALDRLEKMPEEKGEAGSSAAYATYAAIFYAPKGGDYQEKLIERFSRDYDANLKVNFAPHYLDHHLYALQYAAGQSPAKLALIQKIIDTADAAPEPTWAQRLEYPDEDYLFTPRQVLDLLLNAGRIAGAGTAQGQDAIKKWNARVDAITAKDSAQALALVCETDSRYFENPALKETVGTKAISLFDKALDDKDYASVIRHAYSVSGLSGQRDKVAATLRDLATKLEDTDLVNAVRAAGREAILRHGADPIAIPGADEAENEAVAVWSRLVDKLATADIRQAHQALKEVGGAEGKIGEAALEKLSALADLASKQGKPDAARDIARDAANAGLGTDRWRDLIIASSKNDMDGALRATFNASETFSGNGHELSMLAAQLYVDLAAELAQTNPAEGLRRLHTIAHDSAGGRDMFGGKHRESPMGPPATKKWAEIVTGLAKTDPAAALAAARAAVKYWDDKADRDVGRIPGSMYKTAQSFVRKLEHSQPATAPSI